MSYGNPRYALKLRANSGALQTSPVTVPVSIPGDTIPIYSVVTVWGSPIYGTNKDIVEAVDRHYTSPAQAIEIIIPGQTISSGIILPL